MFAWCAYGMMMLIYGWLIIADMFLATGFLYGLQWWEALLSLIALITGTVSLGPFVLWKTWKNYTKKEGE